MKARWVFGVVLALVTTAWAPGTTAPAKPYNASRNAPRLTGLGLGSLALLAPVTAH